MWNAAASVPYKGFGIFSQLPALGERARVRGEIFSPPGVSTFVQPLSPFSKGDAVFSVAAG
jgi:hypothetical protein